MQVALATGTVRAKGSVNPAAQRGLGGAPPATETTGLHAFREGGLSSSPQKSPECGVIS